MADVTVEFGAKDVGLEDVLKTLQTEMEGLKDKLNAGGLEMEEIESTMKRLGQLQGLEKKLKEIGGESDALNPKLDNLNKEITQTGDESVKSGTKAQAGWKDVAIGAGIAEIAVKGAMLAAELAFKAVTASLDTFKSALDLGGELTDMSEQTGVSVGKLLELQRAFQNNGLAADNLQPIFGKMQKAIVDAGDGTSGAAQAFAKLGISLSTLQGMSPDEQFRTLAKAIGGIQDPAERSATSMEIFGKSGGKLTGLFQNFDQEIGNASSELGNFKSIMEANAGSFDTISDNITIIKGKFVEFAAGILDKAKPALEAITEALKQFDAAKFGQDLANAFLGGTKAMDGFGAALKALEAGDLGKAFELMFASIVLQVKQTANEIYASLSAAFKAAGTFVGEIFDTSGALSQTIVSSFEFIGTKAAVTLMRTLAGGFSGSKLTEGLALSLNTAANEANTAANKIEDSLKGAGGRIQEQFIDAGKAFPEAYDKAYNETKPLFDTQQDLDKIDQLTEEVLASSKDVTKEYSASEEEAKGYFQEYMKWSAEQERANNEQKGALEDKAKKEADIIKAKKEEANLDLQLAKAKKDGNDELVTQIGYQKSYNSYLEKAKGLMPVEEAKQWAAEMARLDNPLKTVKQELEDIAKKKIDDPILNMKDATDKLKGDLKLLKDYIGQDLSNVHVMDLAKKFGVDTFRKDAREVMNEIQGKLEKIKNSPIDIKGRIDEVGLKEALTDIKTNVQAEFKGGDAQADGGAGGEGGEGGEGGDFTPEKTVDDNTALNAIMNGVDEIKKLVYKIEPKLPVAALA